MSHVNLLPPALKQRQAVRHTVSLIVAVGLAVLALIGVFYFMQNQKLADVQSELEAQGARNAEVQAQIQELQPYADLQTELASKEALVASLYVNEVSWSSALLDVSRVIPDASYLTTLSGQAGAPPVEGAPETTLIGTMTFSGVADGTETIANWLTRLEQVQGWVNAWASSVQEQQAFSDVYSFSNGIDLTQEAATERGQGQVAP